MSGGREFIRRTAERNPELELVRGNTEADECARPSWGNYSVTGSKGEVFHHYSSLDRVNGN